MAEDTRDSALITLTEKIVESGGKVSDAVGLMGENLIELAGAEKRVEDKLDKMRVETQKCHEETLREFTGQMKLINAFIIKIEQCGLIEFVKTTKKFLSVVTIAIIGGIVWLIFNAALKFYVSTLAVHAIK